MKLNALFSVARADAYAMDSQIKIERILLVLNSYLASRYGENEPAYGSLRALLMHHPDEFQTQVIPGLDEALGNGESSEPVRESFDLLTGFHLDGGDPVFLYTILEPYMSGVCGVKAQTLLANEFQGSASKILIEQNILDPDIALQGLRTWIRYCLNDAVSNKKVVPGLGLMSWAIFEAKTGMRATTPIHNTYVSYFMDDGIETGEIAEIAQSLVLQAGTDFSTYDQGGFENWLREDYLIDMLVYNPALACCLKGLPTSLIVERISPLISILLRDQEARKESAGTAALCVRQGIVNALCLFPERLREIGVQAHEIAGGHISAVEINRSLAATNRLTCSPVDAFQLNACERWLAIRTLDRLEERGLAPDMNLSAVAALQSRVKPTVLLKAVSAQIKLKVLEAFFEGVDPGEVSSQEHPQMRAIIDNLHLPAYSELSRLNMALMLVHRAIDVQASRSERGLKRNNLVTLTFRSPRKIVTDWDRAMPIVLKVFEQKGMYSYHMMTWAGFDSSVLKILSPEAPRRIRDEFIAQDLGL
ncbi:hypothetical protein IFT48_02265 [Pseudomonas fluorescens]|uniref:hypothetical protein n=1 Tax=Pseudomonas fluorescens TaxID=294 RepID=UPI001930D550|nr:hypothetical protein [Pseudomonas fluorescens]MBD8088788.1 hypothetical protein [Pseudomonas fluorescens]